MTSRSRALHPFVRCRLIITTTIYTYPNPNPSPSLSTHLSYNIMTTEAELFAIRYGINQATCVNNINVITDSIYTAERIFDLSLHSYQIHVSSISSKLREFFTKDHNDSIEFWDYPSSCK